MISLHSPDRASYVGLFRVYTRAVNKPTSVLACAMLMVVVGGCATAPAERPGEATPALAVQAGIAENLGMPVALKIESMVRYDEWAFLTGQPVTVNGKPIDYMRTLYAAAFAEGYLDDNFAALVRQASEAGSGWHVMELSIGATDAPFVDWPDRYGLPVTLVSPANGR